MNRSVPTRRLPERPDLEQLKRQAKELQQTSGCVLHEAQLELARSYGFASWPKLRAYVHGVNIQLLTEAVRAGNVDDGLSRGIHLIEDRQQCAHGLACA